MTRRVFALFLLILAGFVQIAPARAQERSDPAKMVAEFAQKGIVDILAAQIPQAERTQRFRTMFKEYFDLPAIGTFVLGRFSRTLSAEDRQKFETLFEDVVVYTWSRRFSEYNGQTLKVLNAAPDGDAGSIVKSQVVDKGGENVAVDFRLRKRPDGFRGVDVIVAGVSMAITYRQEYATILSQQGGFAGLVAQLQKQVDDLKARQPA